MKRFDGLTALITGGASGMGLLCGKNYAAEGANVVLVDCNMDGLEAAVKDVTPLLCEGRGLKTVCIDVRQYDKVEEAAKIAYDTFGRIDILVNCAGGAELRLCHTGGEFMNVPIDVYDFGIDLNLKGPIYFDHAVMPYMAKQMSGVIIHLGSITGEEGCAGNIAYSASKSALMNGVTKSIAQAGARYNIRCCCVAPGPVLTRPAMAGMKTMMGRAAEPQEIVNFILFLTSSDASFATGASYLVDGGRAAMQHG